MSKSKNEITSLSTKPIFNKLYILTERPLSKSVVCQS